MSNSVSNFQGFRFVLRIFYRNRDELRCAFSVADHRLRKLLSDFNQRVQQIIKARVVHAFDRTSSAASGRDQNERVVRGRIAVDGNAIIGSVGHHLNDLAD